MAGLGPTPWLEGEVASRLNELGEIQSAAIALATTLIALKPGQRVAIERTNPMEGTRAPAFMLITQGTVNLSAGSE